MEEAWRTRLDQLEKHHEALSKAEKQRTVAAKSHANSVATAIADTHRLGLIASALHAWARIAERSLLLRRVEGDQKRQLCEARAVRASDLHDWAGKVARTMMT